MANRARSQFEVLVRNLEAGYLWENFLISAIFSLLAIRTLLHLTGYPILGGERLHIAHMLWGGLLMLIAILLMISFLNKEAKQLGSIIGGIGFGAFIDELGKFITQENDYFFQPSIAIIYIVFVFIFLLARALERYFPASEKDYTVNALELIKDVIMADLDEQEKRHAQQFLEQADAKDSVVQSLQHIIDSFDAPSPYQSHIFSDLKRNIRALYVKLVQTKQFNTVLISFFVFISMFNFMQAIFSIGQAVSFFEWGHVVSTIGSGIFVFLGVYYAQRGYRLLAYEMYRYAILITIFLTQFFLFYKEQLSAVIELFLTITIYVAIRYIIMEESLSADDVII